MNVLWLLIAYIKIILIFCEMSFTFDTDRFTYLTKLTAEDKEGCEFFYATEKKSNRKVLISSVEPFTMIYIELGANSIISLITDNLDNNYVCSSDFGTIFGVSCDLQNIKMISLSMKGLECVKDRLSNEGMFIFEIESDIIYYFNFYNKDIKSIKSIDKEIGTENKIIRTISNDNNKIFILSKSIDNSNNSIYSLTLYQVKKVELEFIYSQGYKIKLNDEILVNYDKIENILIIFSYKKYTDEIYCYYYDVNKNKISDPILKFMDFNKRIKIINIHFKKNSSIFKALYEQNYYISENEVKNEFSTIKFSQNLRTSKKIVSLQLIEMLASIRN